MKKFTLLTVVLVFLVGGCTVAHHQGAVAGLLLGGIAGALLDGNNPWRGGVIGGALGAVAGATLTDISVRGSREAARLGRPVEYRTKDGRGVFRAEPISDFYRPDKHTKCRKVRERTWEDGRLIKDVVREICEGEKFERRYITP